MTLAELVASERKRQSLSLRAVAERAGVGVTASTVHAIERGERARIEDETIEALSRGLAVPLDRVRRAAGVARPDTDEPFVLPRRASRLTRKERDLVLGMVDALLEAKKR